MKLLIALTAALLIQTTTPTPMAYAAAPMEKPELHTISPGKKTLGAHLAAILAAGMLAAPGASHAASSEFFEYQPRYDGPVEYTVRGSGFESGSPYTAYKKDKEGRLTGYSTPFAYYIVGTLTQDWGGYEKGDYVLTRQYPGDPNRHIGFLSKKRWELRRD